MKYLISSIFLFCSVFAFGQLAPDFLITDSDGIEHNLYADHLDQGQTVVLKLFFTTCPPCIGLAPWMEEKYQLWGAGQYDVEFIELSTQSFDSNADVAQFKTQYGLTFPGAGADGGSKEAAQVYQSGQFGPYFGTPTLVVIAPDGTVTMGFSYDDFDSVVASTGATGMEGGSGGGTDDMTTYSMMSSISGSSAPNTLKYILKPANADSPQYDILDITGGSLNFDYPSTQFPEIVEPVIIVEAEGSIIDNSVNVLDLLRMRKHILELEPFTDPNHILASDINSDNKINALDLLNLQKAILELITVYPNNTPAWKVSPAQIPLVENVGQTEQVSFSIVKTGNVN